MKYEKAIGLLVAIACALASIWVGAWLTGSVFRHGDWQYFPAFLTSSVFALGSAIRAFQLFLDWDAE